MNPKNTIHVPSPQYARRRTGWWRRLSAAGLTLGLAYLIQPASAQEGPAPTAGSFGAAVLADSPVAFWQLNETGDPSTGTLNAYDFSGHGFLGTYGVDAQNGNASYNFLAPQPPTYGGFAANQGALEVAGNSDNNSLITLPPLGLSSTDVDTTIALWINPNIQEVEYSGLVFNRTADAAGLNFSGTQNDTSTSLGYTWNNTSGSYNWNSGLFPQLGNWSFAVLVVQSNQATIYLDYIDQNTGETVLSSAVNANAQTPEAFGGTTYIGGDPGGNATRIFSGEISDVAIYNSALNSDQVTALFAAGLGVKGFAPSISTQPQPQYAFAGAQAQISPTGILGTKPLAYQWTLNGTNVNLLADSANFTGANSNILTILSVKPADVGSYQLTITNVIGKAVSSNATLAIVSQALVGEWLTNGTLADLSGYSAKGAHDAYDAAGNNDYYWTNDVPPNHFGQAVVFPNSDDGFAISNSSTYDANYDDLFDNQINNTFSVAVWSRGWPTTWSPWVSKYGESEAGWQLRSYGGGPDSAFTVRGSGGTATLGNSGDDMSTTTIPSEDGKWHLYVGVFNTVTGVRSLYVDAQLAANETNNVAYDLAAGEHLAIGCKDSPVGTTSATPGDNFGNYSTMEVYDARIYNYALSQAFILTNLYGSVPAVVNGQPQSLSSFTDEPAHLSVVAGGTTPLTYQWQFNGTNVNALFDSTNFSGGNSSVLSILSVTTNDAGLYSVIVNNKYGTAVSSNATLSIIQRVLVGAWLNGSAAATNLVDVSGYSPAGTHDGYDAAGSGGYSFVDDVPPYRVGQSLSLDGTTAIAISNSATADANYTNTFDGNIAGALSVWFWAKGRGNWTLWDAWVSKDGYNNDSTYDAVGWDVGTEAWSQSLNFNMCGVANGVTAYVLGDGLWGNEILECSPSGLPGDNTKWHFYAATYNANTGVRCTYFDGALVAEQTGDTQYKTAPAEHLVIGGQEQTVGFNYTETQIYDVRVYNYDLTAAEVLAGFGMPDGTPAQIATQPPATVTAACEGVTVQIKAVSGGSAPVTNQWQLNGTNLVDGTYGGVVISGSASELLTIANATTNYQGTYTLVVANAFASVVSSNVSLTIGSTPPEPLPGTNLVGEWLAGSTTLNDVSGYSPAGTHNASVESGTTSWSTDVPPTAPAGSSSLAFTSAGLIVANSSTLDGATYTNTYDDNINTNGMSVICWAKGYPGSWNPWVSKAGDNSTGWQLRVNASDEPCWTMRGPGGGDDMASPSSTDDGNWHLYAGTYDPIQQLRTLYVDGVPVVQETGQAAETSAAVSHLMIGGKDNGGDVFGNYYTGKIFDVRIYNTPLTTNQINSLLVAPPAAVVFSAPPAVINGKLVLQWSTGSLEQATNLTGPWVPSGATSPYTNNLAIPQLFFRLSNP